jgi:single-strand DNA-binding protein
MPDFNRVFLLGHLTRDPEVRYTPKGTAVGELGLAINSTFRSQDGSNREEVVFVDVEVWDRQAETCKQYLTRGSPVFIEGRLKLDQWETKEGEKKSRLRVRAERVQFLGGKGGNTGGEQRQERPARQESRNAERPPPQQNQQQPADASSDEGDIPFN